MAEKNRGKDKSKGKGAEAGAQLRWTGVESMRPTQCSVGMLEVELKMAELTERSRKADCLEKYLKGHPIPAVLGPDGRMYLTDHHHMGLAMLRLERQWDAADKPAALNPFRKCCFRIVEDHSRDESMSMGAFMASMESRSLCHPYAGDGSRAAKIPESLLDLEDDPYRSLAGLARKAGAYDKVELPFTEFKWADFLRSKVPSSLIKPASLAAAIERAVELANGRDAKALPGFKGGRGAKELPTLDEIRARLASRHGADDAAPGLPPIERGTRAPQPV